MGGDPIGGGTTGDTLNLLAGGAAVTFNVGPEIDEGSLVAGTNEPVSYDHLEAIGAFTVTGGATFSGTNDADAITVIARDDSSHAGTDGLQDFTVSVNDGIEVLFVDTPSLTVDALGGSDEITVRAPAPNDAEWDVDVTINGGTPSTDADQLIIETPGTDTVVYTPSATLPDAGVLLIDEATNDSTITINEIEELFYDGEDGDDTLTVTGAGRFAHTPGAAIDAGHVGLDSQLGISYVQLGSAATVTADGTGADDVLVALGTNGSDTVNITFLNDDDIDIDVADASGTHVDLRSNDIESYEIRSGTGDDDINLNANFNVTGGFAVFTDDSGSDSFTFTDAAATDVGITPDANDSDDQLVSGVFTSNITLSGVERIHYDGNSGETLTVDPGLGDNEVTVQRSNDTAADLVTSDSLPDIEFEGVQTFLVDASSAGGDVVTFVTWFLNGATSTNYQMSGVGTDTLVIQGVDGSRGGDDDFLVTKPATGPVAVTDTNGTNVTVTAINEMLGRLQINTLGGDDTVTIDVDGTNVIPTPITFDGGGNSDELRLTGAPLSPTDAVYSPGANVTEGRLQYFEASVPPGTMTVDFISLEPIDDDIVSTLTVVGTDADNAIDYRPGAAGHGIVSVDGFETIQFSNKSDLILRGEAGDDVINLNHAGPAPTGLNTITVIGGNSTRGDSLIVNGSAVTDDIGFTPTSFDSARVTGVQDVTFVDAFTIEAVEINGLGDLAGLGDTLTVNTPAGDIDSSVELTPGTTFDSGTVKVDTLVPMQFRNLTPTGALVVVDTFPTDNDRLIYNGGDSSDAFVVPDPRVSPAAPSIAKVRFIGSIPFLQIPVSSDGVENYTLRGHGGNDTFDITAQTGVEIMVEGDDASNDVVNFTTTGATTVDLDSQTVEDADAIATASPDVLYSGIETINVAGGTQAVTVEGTSLDEMINVTPLTADRAQVQIAGLPLVDVTTSGTFTVDPVGGTDTIAVHATASDDTIDVTDSTVDLTTPSRITVTYATANTEHLKVLTSTGDDTINVAAGVTTPLSIDSDDPVASDTVNLTVTDNARFTQGADSTTALVDQLTGAADINLANVESLNITSDTANSDLTVRGTDDSDTIEVRPQTDPAASVWINDGTIVTFNGANGNFDDLNVEGRFGLDAFVITPIDAVNVSVDGGASNEDTVVVNGTDAIPSTPAIDPAVDTILFRATSTTSGTAQVNALGLVSLSNVESVTIDGQGNDDQLTLETPAGRDLISYEPGDVLGSGDITWSHVFGDQLIPVHYTGFGFQGTLDFTNGGGTREDTLWYGGTVDKDSLRVSSSGTVRFLQESTFAGLDTNTSGINSLVLEGRDGADNFSVTGGHLIDSIRVEGGGPDEGDSLNVLAPVATTGAPHPRVSLGVLGTVSGFSGSIFYSGLASIVADLSGQRLEVESTADVQVEIVSAERGRVSRLDGEGPEIVYLDGSNVPGSEPFFDLASTFQGHNKLVVIGNHSDQQFDIDLASGFVAVDDKSVGAGGIGEDGRIAFSLIDVPSPNLLGKPEVVEVHGLDGSDTFNVTPGTIPVFVDGGDPIGGGTSGDTVNLLAGGAAVTFNAGPEIDEGSLVAGTNEPVSYDHIEAIGAFTVTGGANISGTTDADAITVIARDDSSHTGTDGLQDFTVSVNDGIEVLFVDTPSLTVDALSGSDEITVRAPAPNDAEWDVDVTINGGTPAEDGDQLIVETPGLDAVIYEPTGAGAGVLTIDEATNDSTITINEIEQLIYDAEAADTLTVMLPTASNDDVAIVDFNDAGAGQVRVAAAGVEAWLPIDFTGFVLDSAVEQIQITDLGGVTDTGDTLHVVGSGSADQFDVDNAGNIRLIESLHEHLHVGTDGIESLILDMLGGDDRANVVVLPSPFKEITALAGDPANDDYVQAIMELVTGTHTAALRPLPTPGPDQSSELDISDAIDQLTKLTTISAEVLEVITADPADLLDIEGTAADEQWTIEQGEAGARLALETLLGPPIVLPSIEFSGFGQANFINPGGTDVFRFAPTDLDAAALYNVSGDGNDTLEILGTNNNDTFDQTAANQFTANGRNIQFVANTIEAIRLAGESGSDTFDLDLDVLDSGVQRVILDAADPTNGDDLNVLVTDHASISQGATSTSGIVTDAADGQVVHFANLETINIDSTSDDSTLTVHATDDNDTIEVARTAAPNEARVWINDGTVITLNVGGGDNNFGGAGGLVIAGRFGADQFTATPVAGVPITYQGGSPSDGDTVTVNASDDVEVSALTVDGGQVDVTGFAAITLETVSSLAIRGDGGGETLTATTPLGADNLVFTPGSTVDSGDLQVASLLPLAFSNLGAAGGLVLADAGGSRVDRLTYHGTDSVDNFDLAATSGDIALNSQIVAATPGVMDVTLEGHDNNDHFTVNAPQPYANVTLSGGDSSDNGDTATLNATADTTVTLGGNVATVVGGDLSTATLFAPGVDAVSLNAAANDITIDGTTGNEAFLVAPVSGTRAIVSAGSFAPTLTTDNSGLLNINAAGGGDDTLEVLLTSAGESVTIDSASVEITGGATLHEVHYTAANIGNLTVKGAVGNDTFDVIVDSFTPPIFIDGGDPIASDPADALNVIATTAVAAKLGPEVDEGSLTAAGSHPVSFDHIEATSTTTPVGATLSGTDANDAITIVARDDSTHSGTDGARDFTVSTSDGRAILFVDTPSITVDTLSGSDDITVIMPAPNQEEWDVDVTINGGVGDDTLTLETPGSEPETVDFTPLAIDQGVIKITQAAAATSSQITLGSTAVSPGGTEIFVYNGGGDNDTFNVIGNGAVDGTPDVFVRTLGEVADEGSIRLNNFLPVDYKNVGLNATLNVDGVDGTEDRLLQFGTTRDDGFTVSAGGVGNLVEVSGFIPVSTANTEHLTLVGEGGDDTFRVETTTTFETIDVEATDPGQDEVQVVATDGLIEAFTVSHSNLGAGNVNKSVAANLDVNYTGVELVSVTGNGVEDTLTVEGTPGNDGLLLGGGPAGDRLSGDSQIPVEARGNFDTLTVDISQTSGNDTLTVDVTRLTTAGTFVVEANPNEVDRLVLLGTDTRDRVSSTATSVTIAEGANQNTVQFTPGQLDLITIQTLDGNDNIVLASLAEPKRIEAGDGHDYVDISQSIDGIVLGGEGDDVLRGGPEPDFLDGGPGNDWLFGLGAADTLIGGDGNDHLVGGVGNDVQDGGDGSDTFVWNPGDNNDSLEGGSGDVDVLQFVGGNVPDDFTMSADGTRLRFERSPGNVVIDAADIEQIDTNVTISFARELSGEQEVAPVSTTASGSVQMVYNSADNTFDLDVFVEGIAQTDLTASHIHQAAVGVNGNVILPLGDGADWSVENGGLRRTLRGAELPAANIADLLAGNLYVNVHTNDHSTGELRGQLSLVGNTADLTGGDSFVVNDLTPAGVEVVNLGLGVNDGGEVDSVTISGRTTADTMSLTGSTEINVAGLAYDINISHAVPGEDGLTILGVDGNDTIDVADSIAGSFAVNDVIVDGGAGDDAISGFGDLRGNAGDDVLAGGDIGQILRGGAGNDTLLGGGGDDDLRGGDGEDLFVGGPGADTIDGTGGFDTILIAGGSSGDVISVTQATASQLTHTINGDVQTDSISSIEEARIEAGAGNDLIRTTIADGLFNDPGLSVQMTVLGGASTGAGDRLIIVDDGVDDLTIHRKGISNHDGTVTVGPANAEPLEHEFTSIERLQLVDENGAALNAGTGDDARLVVFKEDAFELNDDRFTATLLGANATVNVDPTIDPAGQVNPFGDGFDIPGDEDWYRLEAVTTGTLDVQVFFEEVADIGSRPGLPGDGNLNIELYDVDGTLIAGNGVFGDNDGANELDTDGDAFNEDERIRIPAVEGQTYYLRVVGNTVDTVNTYDITVVNAASPTPFDLELQDTPVGGNSDTGQSQFDNLTNDTTPTIFLRVNDGTFRFDAPGNDASTTPVDQLIPIPFQAGNGSAGYRIAIFDEGPTPSQDAEAPQTPVGFAEEMATDGLYTFTFPTALTDGSHFLSARVQMIDPADPQQTGFGDRSQSLEIFIDAVAPPVAFGDPFEVNDGLDPSDGDSGVQGVDALFHDRITSDTTPSFFGVAEANSTIRVFVDQNADGAVDGGDTLLGTTTTTPTGTSQQPNGQWSLTSTVDLNDPNFFGTADGVRRLLVTAEDQAGTVSAPDSLIIFVDTHGPQITAVDINNQGNAYSLFDPDPMSGPTPAVNSLVLSIEDLAARSNVDASFLYSAFESGLVNNAGHYSLVGDDSGSIAIASITFTPDAAADGQAATGTITLTFAAPLPDDRFTLTLSDALQDIAGNALDGETNATEPQGAPAFASGDGVPGTSFVARFTIDSRPEIGTASAGAVTVDVNSNGVFDPDNSDAANRDFIYQIGTATDQYFAGNFNTAVMVMDATGFDKIGVYGPSSPQPGQTNPQFRFLLDFDHDGAPDFESVPAAEFQVPAAPIAGDFATHSGDEIGLLAFNSRLGPPEQGSVRPTRSYEARWILDSNGNNLLDATDTVIDLDLSTYPEIEALVADRETFPLVPTDPPTEVDLAAFFIPIVGDFNGDGNDDLALYDNVNDRWSFDVDRDGRRDDTVDFGIPGETERPVANDWNLDGIDDFGVFSANPTLAGQTEPLPQQPADFRFLISDRTGAVPSAIFQPFAPTPLGNDVSFEFGDQSELPVFGNFDPPAARTSGVLPTFAFQNATNALDVNNDGRVSPLDALIVINALNEHGSDDVMAFSEGQFAPPNAYMDVTGDENVSPLDALLVINHLNGVPVVALSEGEGAVQVDSVTPHDAADAVLSTVDDVTPDVESREQIASAFAGVREWVAGATKRVASILQPETQLHRRLPDKLELPADTYNVAPRDLEDVLEDIAVGVKRDDTEGDSTDLEAAIDDVFTDWSE